MSQPLEEIRLLVFVQKLKIENVEKRVIFFVNTGFP